jgi:hypothetical protein
VQPIKAAARDNVLNMVLLGRLGAKVPLAVLAGWLDRRGPVCSKWPPIGMSGITVSIITKLNGPRLQEEVSAFSWKQTWFCTARTAKWTSGG